MTTAVQRRRGTTTEHASFTGLEGEISVNTTKETLVVHDGSTAGGFELARADGSNFVATSVDINGGTIDGTTIGASSASTGAFTTLTASGEITANGGIALGDNDKATFGDGDDLQLYHNGNNSFIEDVGTGNLYLRAANNIFIEGATANESMATFQENGFVKLFFNNEEKLATTNTGIDVTGTATMDGLVVDNTSGAEVIISRNDTSLTDGDFIGGIKFGTNDSSTAYGTPPHYSAGIKAKAFGTVGLMDMHLYAGQTNDAYEEDTPSMTLHYNGDISFYEDTGTTPKFFWDASAESLGIGTSSPTALLHLSSTAPSILMQDSDGTGRSSINCDNGSLNFKFNSNNAVGTSVLTFSDFNTERMRIDSSGNVGIGVTPESTWDSGFNALQVGSRGALWSSTGASGTWLTRNAYYDGTNFKYVATDEASAYEQAADGSHRWSNASSGTADTTLTLTERMRIDSSGNVGIGESSPQRALHVNAGSTDIVALLQSDTNAYLSFWDSVGGVKLGSESGSMVFYEGSNSTGAGGAEAMRIDSSGNLLVGKTSTAVSSDGIEARNNGLLVATRDSNKVAILNRRGSDGDILEFMKDTVAVGSIGSNSGTRTYLVLDPRTAYKGAGITGSSISADVSNIIPTDKNGTIADGDINLGYASSRWKDLYLSGGVYLGGTGAANKLDDYEEGTWTPVASNYSGTMTINRATYEKIGRQITVRASVSFDGTADGSNAIIAGLPFSIPDSDGGAAGMIGRDTSGNCVLVDHQSSASIQFLNASSVGISYSTIGANTIEFTHIYYGS